MLTASATATNVTCPGDHTAAATVMANGGTAPYTYSWSPSGGSAATASNLGAGVYTATVTDAHSCSQTATATVNQVDNTAPSVKTQPATIYLDATGQATVTAAQVNNGSTDNCSIATTTVSPSSFNCASIGNIAGVLNGKLNVDNFFHAYIATSDATLGTEIASGSNFTVTNSLTPTNLVPGTTYYLHIAGGDVGGPQMFIGDFTVSGNFEFANGQQKISTNTTDWHASATGFGGTFISPTSYGTNTGNATWGTFTGLSSGAQFIWGPVRYYDGSQADPELSYFSTPIIYNPNKATVTLTVTDNSGNTANAPAMVTVQDNMAPTAVTKNLTVALNSTGTATVTAADINNGSFDNCGISAQGVSPATLNCSNVIGVSSAGNAMSFTGGYVDVPNEASLNPASTWTLETWVKLSGTGVQHGLIEKYDGGAMYGYLLRVTSGNKLMAGLVTAGSTSGGTYVTGSTSLTSGVWYHVAATCNRTGQIKLYVNGVNDGSGNVTGTIPTNPAVASLKIGARGNDAGERLSGQMDEVRVWSIERTQNDIQATRKQSLSGSETGLQAYYRFEEPTSGTSVSDVTPLTYANTGAIVGSASRTSSAAPVGGTTPVTLTVTDNNGKVSTGISYVTVVDNINPTITAPATVLVNANGGSCAATNVALGTPVTADNCTVVSVTNNAPASYPVGNTIVTWTATDASGLTATATQTVTVADIQAPVVTAPSNIITTADAGVCNATRAVGAATAADNCGVGTPVGVRSDALALTAPYPEGTTTITWSATDIHGNAGSATQTITVTDNQNPTITAPAAVIVNTDAGQCSATNVSLGNATTADNCGVASVSNNAPATYLKGNTTVIWTVTDIHGNTATATQLVTVEDHESPVIVCPVITNAARSMNSGTCTYIAVGGEFDATATDNCGVSTLIYTLSGSTTGTGTTLSGAVFNKGITNVSWTATDAANLTNVCSFNVTVTDDQAPVITCPGNLTISVAPNSCANTYTIADPISDNCTTATWGYAVNGATTVNASGIADGTGSGILTFNKGINTVVLSGTDGTNAAAGCSFTVTVQDDIKPTVHTQNITVQLDATGHASIIPAQINNVSTDNCGISSYSLDKTAFDCSNVGMTNTVTLTVTDVNGNSETGTAIVTVKDEVKPTVHTQNITVQLDATGHASIIPAQINNVSTDNCGISSYSLDKTAFDCSNVGMTNTVTLTVTDVNGNSETGTAIVTVKDEVKPTVHTQNITVQLDATGHASIIPAQINNVSTDNCGISSYSLDKTAFDCSNVGMTNTVTLTVTDVNGNSETGTAIVTVKDEVKPTVHTQNITVQLDATGHASIIPAQINNVSTDNCGISSYSLDKTAFDCSNVGMTNTVTLTVTDVNGNSETGTAIVTVKDEVKPTVHTQNITVQLDATGHASIIPAQINNVSTDNCGISSYSLDKTAFDCSNVGMTNTVTLTVTDVNGNSETGTAIVTVKDEVKPVISAVSPAIVACDAATVSNTYTSGITPMDACGTTTSWAITGATVDNSSTNTGNTLTHAFNVGLSTINWTVKDPSGNTTTVSTTVSIKPRPVAALANTNADAFCNAVYLTGSNTNPSTYLGGTDSYAWSGPLSFSATGQILPLTLSHEDGTYQLVVTRNGCSSTNTTGYTFTRGALASSYVLVGSKEVRLHEYNRVFNGSIGATATNGKIKIDKYTTVNSPGAFVKGYDLDINSLAVVPNQISAPAVIALPTMLAPNTASTSSLSNFTIASNGTYNTNYKEVTVTSSLSVTLGGNLYKKVTIKKDAVVTFTSADITVEQLEVEKNAVVQFANATNIRVSDKVKLDEGVKLNPQGKKVTFYVSDPSSSNSNEKFEVHGGDNASVTANVYMPSGKLHVHGGGNDSATMTGLFIAERIESTSKYVTWNSYNCSGTTSVRLAANSPVSATGTDGTPYGVIIYPNPTNGEFTVQFQQTDAPAEIRILDIQGRVIAQRSVLPTHMPSVSMNLTARPAGVYMIEVRQAGLQQWTRLIVQ